MKRFVIFSAIFFVLLILVSCQTKVNVKLFVRDVVDFAAGEDVKTVPAVVKFEVVSEEDVNDELLRSMKEFFLDVRNLRVENLDYSTFAVADVEIPLSTGEPKNGSIFTLVVKRSGKGYDIGLVLNQLAYERFKSMVYEKTFKEVSSKDFELSFQIENDTRKTVLLRVSHAYLNEKPVPFEKSFKLKRRETSRLKISDVLRDYIFQAGGSEILYMDIQ